MLELTLKGGIFNIKWVSIEVAITNLNLIYIWFKTGVSAWNTLFNLWMQDVNKQYIFLTQIYFCIPEIFKTNVSTQFLGTNLCSSVVNSQRLFCNQTAGVKFSYQSFLVFKGYCVVGKLILHVGIQSFWYKKVFLLQKIRKLTKKPRF